MAHFHQTTFWNHCLFVGENQDAYKETAREREREREREKLMRERD